MGFTVNHQRNMTFKRLAARLPLETQDLTLSLPSVAKGKFRLTFHIFISLSFSLRDKWRHVKVKAESFHLNGHIIGFRP